MNLLNTVVDAIWEGFEDQVCVDRPLNRICDTGDHDFSMERVAQHVINRLASNKIVSTVQALDALPIPAPGGLNGVLITSSYLIDPENGKYGPGEIYERSPDGTWRMLRDPDWGKILVPSKNIPLPAVVLYNPNP